MADTVHVYGLVMASVDDPGAAEQGAAGCWLVAETDFSAAAVFGTEIDALRYAASRSMSVRFVQWGADLRTGRIDD